MTANPNKLSRSRATTHPVRQHDARPLVRHTNAKKELSYPPPPLGRVAEPPKHFAPAAHHMHCLLDRQVDAHRRVVQILESWTVQNATRGMDKCVGCLIHGWAL